MDEAVEGGSRRKILEKKIPVTTSEMANGAGNKTDLLKLDQYLNTTEKHKHTSKKGARMWRANQRGETQVILGAARLTAKHGTDRLSTASRVKLKRTGVSELVG